jgi:VanZ family protein
MIRKQELLQSVTEKRERILRWLFLLYVTGIILASLMPSDLMPRTGQLHFDKVEHFLAYTGLSFLIGLTFVTGHGRVVAALCVIGMGFLLEGGQFFLPGRDMSLADGLVNTGGVLLGLLLFRLWDQPITALLDRYLV